MTSEETYLAWLHHALWGGNAPTAVDGEVLRIAALQKTRGLVFNALLKSDITLDQDTRLRMQQFLVQTIFTHKKLDSALVRVMTALREADIPAVLLKGQGLARNYPDPQMRECGDIDLYIGPERLEEAIRVLRPVVERVDERIHADKHCTFGIGSAIIELHKRSSLTYSRRLERFYHALETEGCSRGLVPLDFDGVQVDTPEPTFNAFYVFFHAWDHFLECGIGLRQLCDWALLLHAQRAQIDRERLGTILDGMQVRRPWQLFGCIAVEVLGLPAEEMPFYDARRSRTSRRILRLILQEGNFGTGRRSLSRRPNNFFFGKAYTFFCTFGRCCKLLPLAPGQVSKRFVSASCRRFNDAFKDL